MQILSDSDLFSKAISLPASDDQLNYVRAMAKDEHQVVRVTDLLHTHSTLEITNERTIFDRCGEAIREYNPLGMFTDSESDIQGSNIETYEILELLGEGGMALVYSAEQKSPLSRKVALKLLKAGMDSKDPSTIRD